MARLQSFERDLKLAIAGIAPENVAKALADFAKAELANVIASGEGSPLYDRYVNGALGAPESAVVPPGPIIYDFVWWQAIIPYALQYLVDRSPERSGRYKRSWFVMVNGQPAPDPAGIPLDAEVVITNDQPYSRKIDVGHMKMSVPNHIIEDGRQAVMRIFGNIITAKRTLIALPGGYTLKSSRGSRRKDRAAGQALTYPALVLQMRS